MTRASCQVFPSLSCTPKVNICLDFFFNQRVNMVVWLLSQSRFCNKEDHWVKTCGRLLLQHCPVRSHSSGRGSSCRPSAVRMPLMRANSQAQSATSFPDSSQGFKKILYWSKCDWHRKDPSLLSAPFSQHLSLKSTAAFMGPIDKVKLTKQDLSSQAEQFSSSLHSYTNTGTRCKLENCSVPLTAACI